MTIFITLGDLLAIGATAVVLVILGSLTWRHSLTMARCRHDGGVNETQACDAICRKCGKNLGFIGSWRDAQALKEKS